MRRRLFGLLAGAVFAFAACQGAATPSPSGPGATPGGTPAGTPAPPATGEPDLFTTKYADERTDGQAGGTVIVADWQEATLFQPFYAGQVTETDVYTAAFAGLVVQTHDFRYAPDLAEGEPPTLANEGVTLGQGGDAMTVTWKLKSGLKWSDGQDLNCDDFAYTQDWVMDPDNTGLYGGTSGYEDITKVDCPDPLTIVYHYKNIYEGYLGIPLVVLPQHYFSKFPIKDQVNGKGTAAADMPNVPVSGPFKFESITSGQELRMVRNDQWKNPFTGQPAYLESLVFKWYGDADAMIAGYKSNEFDLAKDLNDADLPKVTDLADQVVQLNSLTYEFLRPNWNAEVCSPRVTDRGTGCPVSDPAIREAIRWAVNKDDINARLLGGNAALGFTNVSPNAWYYSEPPTYTYDPAKAMAVLDAAGWVPGADGIREKDGVKAKIELCTTTRQVRQDTLALVSAWLKDVGIDSTVLAVSPDDIFATFNEGTDDTPCNLSRHKFDVAEHAFSVPLDPQSNYGVYHSSQEAPNGQNDASIDDSEVDRIMDGVRTTVDFAEIRTLMADWQTLYVDKTIEIPMYFRKEVYLRNTRIQNFTGNPTTGGPIWNAGDWFVTGG